MKIVTQNLCQTWCHHMLMHFSIKHWLQHRCIQVLAIGTKKVQVIHLNTSGSFDLSWHIYGHFVDWGHLGYSGVIIGERKWRVHCLTSGKPDWVTTWPPPQNHQVGKIGAIGSHTMIWHVNIMTALKRLLTCKAYWCLYM